MVTKAFFVGLFVVAGLVACSDDHHGEEEGAPSGAACAPAEGLSYESFGRSFMETYCTRCHSSTLSGAARNGAPLNHDFDTFLGVFDVAEHIDEYAAAGPAAVNEKMPISDPRPSLGERQKLGRWLACEIANADGGLPDGI